MSKKKRENSKLVNFVVQTQTTLPTQPFGFKSSIPGLPDGYALRHGFQMTWPDVHVSSYAHLDIYNMIFVSFKTKQSRL